MTSRVQGRSVRKTLQNADVQQLFQSAVGGGDAALDYTVVWPKFKKVRRRVRNTVSIIKWLTKQPWLGKAFPVEAKTIAAYAKQLETEYEASFGAAPDLDAGVSAAELVALDAKEAPGSGGSKEAGGDAADDFTPDFASVPEDDLEAFTGLYRRCMDCDLLNTCVKICTNLSEFKSSLEDKEKLDKKFLFVGARHDVAPLPACPAANFKSFYLSDQISPKNKESLVVYLHCLYTSSHRVYEEALTPDFNVDSFTAVILDSIESLKGQPELRGCTEAFRRISDSLDLLKSNFAVYHRDVKISGNQSLLMENFVLDVAGQSEGASPKVKSQFSRIIRHYRKLAQNQPRLDPKAQAIFSELDRNFVELEKTGKGGAKESENPPPDSAPEEGTSASAPEEGAGAAPPALSKSTKKSLAKARNATARSIRTHVDGEARDAFGGSELYRALMGDGAPPAAASD